MADKPPVSIVKAAVPAELWARVRAAGILRGLQVPEIVTEALQLWLAQEERRPQR
jgi:hypothetical protein